MLNKNEVKILEVIDRDPFISQQKIADELGLTRSTVATIISGLTQKKHLLGRAYVVNKASGIYCIGAMNVDRTFHLFDEVVDRTSNPASSNVHAGGVARNIAENLGRMDLDVSLISMGGYDQDFQYIKRETEQYVNMQHAIQLNGYATGTYNAILDHQGDMQLAVGDMQINDEMTVEWLMNYQNILKDARLLVVDLNLPIETIEYIISVAQQYQIEIFLVPASAPKMDRLPYELAGVDWMIATKEESESYFGVTIETEADFDHLVDRWLATGVGHVIITREDANSIYASQEGEREWIPPVKTDFVVDINGAGNTFVSGLIYGIVRGLSTLEAIQQGLKRIAQTMKV